MPTTRRFFLKAASVAAFAAGISLNKVPFAHAQDPSKDFPIPMEAQQDPVFMFRSGTFEPYVNGIFQAPDAQGRMIQLTLLSVTVYRANPRTRLTKGQRGVTESFSLMFRASRPLPPFTSIHKITHGALGDFDLFLTHRVGTDDRDYYEAVFNHLR